MGGMNEPPKPTENYDLYIECVRDNLLLKPEQWTFKSDPRYQLVLEHTTSTEARLSYSCAEIEMAAVPDLRKIMGALAVENDRLGAPEQKTIEDYGFVASPGNGRYFWHAIALLKHIQRCGLSRVNIVELGGGFGGLGFYVRRLETLFPVIVTSYTSVDVVPVVLLQNRYFDATDTAAVAIDGLDMDQLRAVTTQRGPKVFFSAYAFSEFDAEMRDWYVEHLLPACERGFVVWNFTGGFYNPSVSSKVLGGGVYQFVRQPLSIEPERPLIRDGQLFVTW